MVSEEKIKMGKVNWRLTQSDGKSSHCFRLGELKTTINQLSDTGENHWAAASHCKLYPIMLYCVHLAMHRVETYNFWSSVVIGSDCTGSSTTIRSWRPPSKSNLFSPWYRWQNCSLGVRTTIFCSRGYQTTCIIYLTRNVCITKYVRLYKLSNGIMVMTPK